MKHLLIALAASALAAASANAAIINYSTAGSTLSCNGVSGCVQNSTTQVTVGGITLAYNSDLASNVQTPSIINLGNLVTTGTSNGVSLSGILLTIRVLSTPPGTAGNLPNGTVSGTISTNQSGAIIQFSPNNTTTGFGTLPGVTISGGGVSLVYQVLNPTLGIVPPTPADGITFGQTTIQGAVSDVTPTGTPEPTTILLMGAGLGALGLLRRKA